MDTIYLISFTSLTYLTGISNVKSREDLVMDLSSLEADPFGAAPFNVTSGEFYRPHSVLQLNVFFLIKSFSFLNIYKYYKFTRKIILF